MTMAGRFVCALLVLACGGAVRLAVFASRRGGVARRLDEDHREASRAAVGGAGVLRRLGGRPPRWLPPALAAAAVDLEPAVAWALWWIGGGVLVLVVLIVGGVLTAGLALAVAIVGPIVALRVRRGEGSARVEAALPAALEAMARALRSGGSMRQAVVEAAVATRGPLAAELQVVALHAARGIPLVTALERLAERQSLAGVRLAVAALCLGVETGGAQARAVDGVASTLRDRLAVTAEVRALSAQARLSALIIGVAPIGFGAFAAPTDTRTARFVFHTLPGLLLLAVGLALDGLGWLWMRRLSRVAV